jgi:hypothetical protein
MPTEKKNGVGEVIDPTKNVLDLVEAAVKRLDDLRTAEGRVIEARLAHHKELADVRAQYARDFGILKSAHSTELRVAEQNRIDAIRAVDVNAVSVASSRAAEQAQVLANQVQVSADALRTLVATTASTAAAAQQAALAEISKRLSELERTKYEGAGRSTIADPALSELMRAVQDLARGSATSAGKGAGVNAVWVVVIGAVGLISTLLGIAGVLYAVLKP